MESTANHIGLPRALAEPCRTARGRAENVCVESVDMLSNRPAPIAEARQVGAPRPVCPDVCKPHSPGPLYRLAQILASSPVHVSAIVLTLRNIATASAAGCGQAAAVHRLVYVGNDDPNFLWRHSQCSPSAFAARHPCPLRLEGCLPFKQQYALSSGAFCNMGMLPLPGTQRGRRRRIRRRPPQASDRSGAAGRRWFSSGVGVVGAVSNVAGERRAAAGGGRGKSLHGGGGGSYRSSWARHDAPHSWSHQRAEHTSSPSARCLE